MPFARFARCLDFFSGCILAKSWDDRNYIILFSCSDKISNACYALDDYRAAKVPMDFAENTAKNEEICRNLTF